MAHVRAAQEPGPCSHCDSAGSVSRGVCEVCLSGFGRNGVGPSSSELGSSARLAAIDRPILHPSIPLRFGDVIAELQRIAAMATAEDPLDPSTVRDACRRAESLLRILRRQFLQDVAIG
jgi:hypothetical protein